MKWELLQDGNLDPVYRMIHRSRHIYILFAALINLLVSLSWVRAEGWRNLVRCSASGLILISGVLLPIAFVVEPGLRRIAAPITFYGVVSALAGTVLFVATQLLPARRTISGNGLVIRRFDERDRAAVVDLWLKSGLVVPANDPVRDIADKVRFQPELFFVGVLSNRVVATVMAGYDGHRGWINYLAVDPDVRRRGYATLLMKHAADVLSTIGCRKINLQVREENREVTGLYKKLGFLVEPRIQMGMRL